MARQHETMCHMAKGAHRKKGSHWGRKSRGSRGGKGSPGIWSKVELFEIGGGGTFVRGDIEKSHKDNGENNGKLTEASQR